MIPIPHPTPMGFTEFVGFIAACMALNALAIDVMPPALPMLNADFGLADPNHAQMVIAIYLLGTGLLAALLRPIVGSLRQAAGAHRRPSGLRDRGPAVVPSPAASAPCLRRLLQGFRCRGAARDRGIAGAAPTRRADGPRHVCWR